MKAAIAKPHNFRCSVCENFGRIRTFRFPPVGISPHSQLGPVVEKLREIETDSCCSLISFGFGPGTGGEHNFFASSLFLLTTRSANVDGDIYVFILNGRSNRRLGISERFSNREHLWHIHYSSHTVRLEWNNGMVRCQQILFRYC